MSNRIDSRLAEMGGQGRCALIAFVTAGDPAPELTVAAMHALVAAGADIIELGMPFSDPMADGPVIQRSSERALAKGMSLRKTLDALAEFRRSDSRTPVVLMGYLNPIEYMGMDAFAERASAGGADGVLLVDCPVEELDTCGQTLSGHGLRQIFLLSPTTSAQRVEQICAQGQGFLYYVSLKGITGAGSLATDEVAASLQALRARSRVPVAVGFGIKTAEQAAALGNAADAVVIGSALVERLAEASNAEQLAAIAREVLSPLRRALDDVRGSRAA